MRAARAGRSIEQGGIADPFGNDLRADAHDAIAPDGVEAGEIGEAVLDIGVEPARVLLLHGFHGEILALGESGAEGFQDVETRVFLAQPQEDGAGFLQDVRSWIWMPTM